MKMICQRLIYMNEFGVFEKNQCLLLFEILFSFFFHLNVGVYNRWVNIRAEKFISNEIACCA